jgi:hypothetical protein
LQFPESAIETDAVAIPNGRKVDLTTVSLHGPKRYKIPAQITHFPVSGCSLVLLGSPVSRQSLNRSLPEGSLRANVPYYRQPGEFGHYTRRSLGISTVFRERHKTTV